MGRREREHFDGPYTIEQAGPKSWRVVYDRRVSEPKLLWMARAECRLLNEAYQRGYVAATLDFVRVTGADLGPLADRLAKPGPVARPAAVSKISTTRNNEKNICNG